MGNRTLLTSQFCFEEQKLKITLQKENLDKKVMNILKLWLNKKVKQRNLRFGCEALAQSYTIHRRVQKHGRREGVSRICVWYDWFWSKHALTATAKERIKRKNRMTRILKLSSLLQNMHFYTDKNRKMHQKRVITCAPSPQSKSMMSWSFRRATQLTPLVCEGLHEAVPTKVNSRSDPVVAI